MDNRPIGVFDSGLGGLTVMKEIMRRMPQESIIYFGDTGRVPYGTRSSETIQKYTEQDIQFLLQFDIKAIVIACGTASSVAMEHVRAQFDLPIIGVVQPTAKMAAQQTRNKKIGILGTNGTIRSGAYQRLLAEIDGDIQVVTAACPLFVPIVENGYAESQIAHIAAEEYLQPMMQAGVDTIILGCTHYPLLKNVISAIMGNSVTLIDSGVPTSHYINNLLSEQGLLSSKQPQYRFYVSDEVENFTNLAGMFLQLEMQHQVEKIEIEKY